MTKRNPVVHFEMPAKDKARVKKFYEAAFGWQMTLRGPEMDNYLLAVTGEADESGRPTQPGTINGGFFDRREEEGYTAPHLIISVDNLADAIEKLQAAGGTVFTAEMDIPGIGRYASFRDTEDNLVGVLQPSRS